MVRLLRAVFVKTAQPTDEGYAAAAWLLIAEPRALKAIAKVEAGPQGAFLPDDRPVILFERHIFHRLTDGRFDHDAPDLSNSQPSPPGTYGSSPQQHERLARAALLDRDAALQACSWGLYQILGLNHTAAGYPELQRFVNAMYRSADDHLRALVLFIRNDGRLVDAIRSLSWSAFARYYNGPNFAASGYDRRMARAYAELA